MTGVIANNRQNYAQDLQISVRGFGARSSFGVRGVRIYVDDIPASMPDGQGQISHIDLGSADHILARNMELNVAAFLTRTTNESPTISSVMRVLHALPAFTPSALQSNSASQSGVDAA